MSERSGRWAAAGEVHRRLAGDLVEHGQEELVEVLEALVEVARREIRLCADGSDRRGRPAVGAEQLESGLDQGGAATGDSHRRLDSAVATCGCSAAAHFVYSDNNRWQIGFLWVLTVTPATSPAAARCSARYTRSTWSGCSTGSARSASARSRRSTTSARVSIR